MNANTQPSLKRKKIDLRSAVKAKPRSGTYNHFLRQGVHVRRDSVIPAHIDPKSMELIAEVKTGRKLDRQILFVSPDGDRFTVRDQGHHVHEVTRRAMRKWLNSNKVITLKGI